MSFREERSNRLFGRVGRREREGEGFHPRLGNLAPDDHIVDSERITLEDRPRLVRTAQVQAHDEGENLEPCELLSDVPRNSLPSLHHELVLTDDDLPALDRGGDAGLLELPDNGTGFERRLARPDPEVLGSDLTSSGGGPRLRRLEFLEQTERIDVGGHDRRLPFDRLPTFHAIRL